MLRFSVLFLTLLGSTIDIGYAATPTPQQFSAKSGDEEMERAVILEKVQTAIASNDFATLDAMESDFRTSRSRMPSGVWNLAVFHAGLQAYLSEGLQTEDGCQYRKAGFVKQWTAASPNAPAPAITDAALLLAQAWCVRGRGYADTVAEDAWPKFRNGVDAAYNSLETRKKTASIDPEFYAVKVDILRGRGVSKAVFQEALEEAITREPAYHRTYFNAAWSFLPQWGGSFEEVEAFARFAAQRTRASEKSGLYMRIFWSLDECGCRIIETAADWPTLRQSMQDIYAQYPAIWNAEYFSDLSCKMGDRDEGHRYIRAQHPETDDERSFIAMFMACDNRAKQTD